MLANVIHVNSLLITQYLDECSRSISSILSHKFAHPLLHGLQSFFMMPRPVNILTPVYPVTPCCVFSHTLKAKAVYLVTPAVYFVTHLIRILLREKYNKHLLCGMTTSKEVL